MVHIVEFVTVGSTVVFLRTCMQTVQAMMRGDPLYVAGTVNRVALHALLPLLPRRVAMLMVEQLWKGDDTH